MIGYELWHNTQTSWMKEVAIDESAIRQDQILVRSIASLVSLGTERLAITRPLDTETSLNMLFPHIKGDFNRGDFTYGYSLVGEVLAGRNDLVGKRVHLLHPHQSYALVPADSAYVLPETIDSHQAVLLSNLETVINAIWDSQVSLGDRVLVIGYGGIGSLLAQVLKQMPGVSVNITEADSVKKNHAQSIFPHDYERESFDLVFHTTATAAGLQRGIKSLKKEGALIELSWYGSRKVSLSLGNDFHYDRKRIICSQVGSIPLSKPNWDYQSRKDLALKLIDSIDFKHFITKSLPFDETPVFYQQVRAGRVNEIGTLITY